MKKPFFLNRCNAGKIIIAFALTFCNTGCKKTNSGPDLARTNIAVSNISLAELNAQADASFNAITATFLKTSGSTQYFKTALNDETKDYFWCQALDIQMVEDTYLRTKSTAHKTLVTNLLNTFLQQNQGTGGLTDWNWNDYNDDILWAGIAFVRPLDHGYYRLISQNNTSFSLDVIGGSNANDTPIQIYGTNSNSSQYFKLVYDYDGYYKLKPRCAPASCVNVKGAGTANGTKCVLWPESFVDNERWLMQLQ